MLTPSRSPAAPGLTAFSPQLPPASVMYGRFVYEIVWPLAFDAPWYAQYCVPKPDELWPCGVATTYDAYLKKPTCASRAAASARICASVGLAGTGFVESTHVPWSCAVSFAMCCVRPLTI